MTFDGPRRQGRFLKKGAKVLEKVSLVEFSFQEINQAKTIMHDNYRRSIIHSQYHEEEELGATVIDSDKFNQDLMSSDRARPIILPLDFTQDWERDKMMRKDRVARSDEEEYDYEMESLRRRSQEQEVRAESDAAAASEAAMLAGNAAGEAPGLAASPADNHNQKTGQAAASPAAGKAVAGGGAMVTGTEKQWQYMDQVGQAIKSLAHTAPEAPSQPAQRPAKVAAVSEGASEFIPVGFGGEAQAAGDGTPVHAPEEEAVKAYQQRLVEQQEREAEWAIQAEAAKAEGYRDGFRAGEEKADLQVRQTAGQMFSKLAELIGEFSQLKHLVLDNVQENFHELCQAMGESLLRREFSIKPEAFVGVMRRAIAEAVEPGKFQLHVHPEFYDKILQLAPADVQDLRASLVKDPGIAPGDFKIESALSVVDVTVKKMITDLLAQADLELFKADGAGQEKAS